MSWKRLLLPAALLLAPVGLRAESPLPSGRLDLEGLPNRYARRAAAYHRTRAVHRARRLQHGIFKQAENPKEPAPRPRLPWEKPRPTRFEQSFVARLAQAFIDTIPAGGSQKWDLRLKVILE
jgi:hypothetical protein